MRSPTSAAEPVASAVAPAGDRLVETVPAAAEIVVVPQTPGAAAPTVLFKRLRAAVICSLFLHLAGLAGLACYRGDFSPGVGGGEVLVLVLNVTAETPPEPVPASIQIVPPTEPPPERLAELQRPLTETETPVAAHSPEDAADSIMPQPPRSDLERWDADETVPAAAVRTMPPPPRTRPPTDVRRPTPAAAVTTTPQAVAADSPVTPPRKLADNPRLAYPADARAAGREGRVLVLAMIDERGAVVRATLHRSSGHASLDAAAVAAVRTWRYAPAGRNGRAIAYEAVVPVTFRLR
jgi:protein TonB